MQSTTVVQQEPVIRAARVRGWVAAPVAADIITDIKNENLIVTRAAPRWEAVRPVTGG